MSSPSDAIRLPAEQFLFASFQTDPFPFVLRTSTLLLSDDIPLPILHAAIICVGRALSPTRSAPLHTIASVFMTADKCSARSMIHRALLRGLTHPDQIIRQSSAHSVDLLLHIECDSWLSLFPSLLELCASPDATPDSRHGALCAFREILTSGVPADQIIDHLMPFYSLLLHILAAPTPARDPVFAEASKAFPVLVGQVVAHQSADQVDEILQIVEQLLPHDSFDVFQSMLDALARLVRAIYAHVEPFMERIFSLCAAGLRFGGVDRRLSILTFWSEFAQFESELSAAHDFAVARRLPAPPPSLRLTARAASALCPAVVDLMRLLEPEFDASAIDFASPPIVASEHLADLYAAAPDVVGPGVLLLWREGASSGEWRAQATALMCLIAVAAAGPAHRRHSCALFEEVLPGLLECCGSAHDSLAYLSLALLARVLSVFRVAHASLGGARLLAVIEGTRGRRAVVVRGGCDCLAALCRASRADDERSPLACAFDRALAFLGALLPSPALLADALAAAALVVAAMPNSRLPACERFVALAERADGGFAVEAAACNLLNVVARRLGRALGALAGRAMRVLLGPHRSPVFEEALLAVEAVLRAIGAEFAPFLPQTVEAVWAMLQTANPPCVARALAVLGGLFEALPREMERCAHDAFALLMPMAVDDALDPEFRVAVARALAGICAAVPHAVASEQREAVLAALVRIAREARFDVQSLAGVERASEFFEALMGGYRAVIEGARGGEAFAEANQDAFFEVVALFVAVRACSRGSLLAFFRLLRVMAVEIPGRNARIRLNKRPIREFLRESAERTDGEIEGEAKDLMHFLRTYKAKEA